MLFSISLFMMYINVPSKAMIVNQKTRAEKRLKMIPQLSSTCNPWHMRFIPLKRHNDKKKSFDPTPAPHHYFWRLKRTVEC